MTYLNFENKTIQIKQQSFEKEWNLNECKFLSDNIIEQKEIHSKFKLIVQHLFDMIILIYYQKYTSESQESKNRHIW